MSADNVKIEKSWKKVLFREFQKPYFNELSTALKSAISDGKIIYPPGPLIFRAFELTPFNELKVVILGQDPYHNPGQAMGLSFSVPKGVRTPPSLKNVYKELHSDIGFSIPDHGDLTQWAEQGVFLLNAMLTVEERKPGSHKKIGWQKFTDAVIKTISDNKEGIIFMLWGRYAQSKKVLIDTEKHHVLEAAHPSPLARNAFSGCKHFSKCNHLLIEQGQSIINWTID
jgi:uracil-DNA glycosylase